MNEFTMGGAWSHGYQFVARGTAMHLVILLLIGIVAPVALQVAANGAPFDASPMTSGPAILRAAGAPVFLLVVGLAHVLQAGSFFASLRFGFTGAEASGGAVGYGLAAGFIAALVIAAGYLIATFGVQAIAPTQNLELAALILILPLVLVYSLFFIGQAILGAASLLLMFAYMFVVGAINGYPGALFMFFGSAGVTLIMILLSGLLFWLAARFSCVTAVMAERGSPNVFEAIGESWRLTSDAQWAITRYITLVAFGLAILVIGVQLGVGASTGGLTQGGGLGLGDTGDTVLRLLLGIPVVFLSVMLPAGIYRQLAGEETPVEVFE